MNKKIIAIIVVCLILVATEIGFIVMNPKSDAVSTEPATTENTTEAPETTDIPTEAVTTTAENGTEVKETEVKETEVKETEVKETEVKETEVKETEPKETEAEETETKETEPEETKTESTDPEDYDNTGTNIGGSGESSLTGDSEYERYMNMSAEDQEKIYNSFENPADFFAWYNRIKQEYEDSREVIEIGPDATIDLSGIGD